MLPHPPRVTNYDVNHPKVARLCSFDVGVFPGILCSALHRRFPALTLEYHLPLTLLCWESGAFHPANFSLSSSQLHRRDVFRSARIVSRALVFRLHGRSTHPTRTTSALTYTHLFLASPPSLFHQRISGLKGTSGVSGSKSSCSDADAEQSHSRRLSERQHSCYI